MIHEELSGKIIGMETRIAPARSWRTRQSRSSCLNFIRAIRLIRGSFETLKIVASLAPKDN
jgi:hypothetical protein